MIKAVIFDIGGVLAFDVWENLLLDSTYGIASIYKLDGELVKNVGQNLWKDFAHDPSLNEKSDWQELEREYWSRFINELGVSIPIGELINITDEFIQPINGMQQLIKDLYSKGIKLAICSDNTEFWFQRQMNKLGYAQFFASSHVVLSNRIGFAKGSPGFEMFQAVVDSLELAKELCVFVDDRVSNVEQALKFSLPTVLFPSYSEYGFKYLEVLFTKMGLP